MPEYKLVVNEVGVTILDQDSQTVDTKAALSLVDTLRGCYEPPACVYFLHCQSKNLYKIGMTSQPIKARLSQIRYEENTRDIVVVHTIECDKSSQAADLEFAFHSLFSVSGHHRMYGEWFRIAAEDLKTIKELKTFIRAVDTVVLGWREVLKNYGRANFNPREQTTYSRLEAQWEVWQDQREREMSRLINQHDRLVDQYQSLDEQIEVLIKQRDRLLPEIQALGQRIDLLEARLE